MLKLHLIVGARPNYMKMAPLFDEFAMYPDKYIVRLVHTGQHYDESMSKLFFLDLKMPKPDIFLEVGSGSHGEQTARVMERYEKYLLQDKPDVVFVAGDVNSTMACAIDASKLRIPLAHVEAGLRSYDRTMPEEINRLLTDQIADYLLTPTPEAGENLLREGIEKKKIHFVGNIMIDSLAKNLEQAHKSYILRELGLQENRSIDKYCLVTLHRPSNVDEKAGLETILEAFQVISNREKIVFPMHPRTQKNMRSFGLEKAFSAIPDLIITEPLGYLDFLQLEQNADFIVTDSGGIQEETTYLQIPCLTIRNNTERPITISEGTNQLVNLDAEKIISAMEEIIKGNRKQGSIPKYWDGQTSKRIVEIFSRL